MTSRPVAMVLLGSLLSTLPAAADRRSKRRVAEEEVDKEDGDGPEATAVLPIKLDDLIEVAVRLAPELARSKNERLAAKGDAVAARREQQWVVTADGKYSRFAFSPDVQVGPFGTVAEDKLLASLGIGRNLPTGGNVNFSIGIQRTLREIEIPALLGEQVSGSVQVPAEADGGDVVYDKYGLVNSTAKLTVKQPLVRGFGRDVALAQQTKGDLVATEATIKTQLAAEEMLRDVVGAYWELHYASYEVDTRAEALALAKKQEELTRIEIRAKTAPDSALTAVLYEVQIREESLLAAKTEWEKKSREMRKRAGLELERRDLVMRPAEPFEAADDEWETEDVLARARKSNRRMATLVLQKRAADVDVKVAKNSMLPKVDLELSGTLMGSGNTTDASLTAVTNSNGYEVMAGLTVQFDIGGAAKGAHDAARARKQKVEVDLADVARNLDADVVQAVNAVKSARARVAFADKAIQYAEENVRAERASFQAKQRTNFDVMQRQTELVNARLRRGRAVADYHLAVANVQFLGGFLLEQYRVNVRPLAKR